MAKCRHPQKKPRYSQSKQGTTPLRGVCYLAIMRVSQQMAAILMMISRLHSIRMTLNGGKMVVTLEISRGLKWKESIDLRKLSNSTDRLRGRKRLRREGLNRGERCIFKILHVLTANHMWALWKVMWDLPNF
jgi:hypothetical protein